MKLPKDWQTLRLAELVDPERPISYGVVQTGENVAGGVPCVRVIDLTAGTFDPSNMIRTSPKISASYSRTILRKGDLMMALRGEIGKAALVPSSLAGANLTRGIALIAQNPRKVVSEYLLQALSSRKTKLAIRHGINGTGLMEIPIGNLREVTVDIPPLPVQLKIASILGAWDEALEILDSLIEAKESRNQDLRQELLTGVRRLATFTKPWSQTTFGQLLVESRIEGSDGLTARKITVKLYGRGVLAKQERMVGSSNTKYFIRRSGQIIYSKLDFLNGAFGIIPPELDGYESTLDLPAFDVKSNADAHWLLAYLARPEFYERQVGAATGGRIARRVNPPQFLKLRLKAPDATEQRAIADILTTAAAELRLLREQRTAIHQQKRGLMQQLLTGQVRVNP